MSEIPCDICTCPEDDCASYMLCTACQAHLKGDVKICENTIAILQVALLRARNDLRVYGGHASSCPGRPCNCGFQAAWDKHIGTDHKVRENP